MGYRISDLDPASQAKGNMLFEVADLSEANSNDQSKKLSLDQIKDYITLSIPPTPVGVTWITKPTVTKTDASVSVSAGEADFNGTQVTYSVFTKDLTLPEEGLVRRDALAAKPDGSYAYITGIAGTTVLDPAIPSDSLFVAYVLVTNLGVEVQQPVDADFDSYTLTETFQNADVFPLQRTGKQKLRYTWQGLVSAVKAIFGTGIQPFNSTLSYKAGDTFRDGDIVYEVVTGWAASAYLNVNSIPTERTKLLANLGAYFARISTLTHALPTVGFLHNIQKQAYTLNPEAPQGQSIEFTIPSGRIPLGREYAIYVKYNGISTLRTSETGRIAGDLSWPSGLVSGDWVCFEFLAKEEGKLSLTQKYIEGKAGSGTSQSASTGLPASSTLVFGNQLGESHEPLISSTAVTFTLGAGPHVPMTTKRQPVILTAAAAINFSGPFTFQYHNIGATLAAGTYEFWFTYNEDGTVSVSVPGSGMEAAPGGGTSFTEAQVRATPLTGYSKASTATAITETDTLLAALGKLEKKTESTASYTPPIPFTRTAQTGTTLVFNQSKDQFRALTANLIITDITGPVQGEEIVLEVDGTGNAFTFSIASVSDTVRIINSSAFTPGKINYVGLRCVNASANTYIINYIS